MEGYALHTSCVHCPNGITERLLGAFELAVHTSPGETKAGLGFFVEGFALHTSRMLVKLMRTRPLHRRL